MQARLQQETVSIGFLLHGLETMITCAEIVEELTESGITALEDPEQSTKLFRE